MDQPPPMPSICGLHPGIAVTGFCSACLRERLAGLHPADPAELRRCKSFSYARSAAAYFEPQRRSCDARGAAAFLHQDLPPGHGEDELEDVPPQSTVRPMKDHINQDSSKKTFGGGLGKKWQEWRRKSKLKKQGPAAPAAATAAASRAAIDAHRSFRDTHSEVAVGRRSVDVDSSRLWMDAGRISVDEPPRASWQRLPPTVEDAPIPRSDGQIPVEEDDDAEPGGCSQTRDYYLDSSSSSRRRRSVDRSSFSSRKSFSDTNDLPRVIAAANANARVSPAIGAEFYHYHHAQGQSVLDHNQHWEVQGPNSYSLRDDDMSGSFNSAAFQEGMPVPLPAKKSNKWIKNIWGLIHKKSSTKESQAASIANRSFSETWPELRARGYNGQMLRCNSSVSARSSFSNSGAAVGAVNGRRRSNAEMHVNGLGRTRKDEVLLERNFSARYSTCPVDNGMFLNPVGGSRRHQNGMSGKGKPARSSNSLPRSALGMY